MLKRFTLLALISTLFRLHAIATSPNNCSRICLHLTHIIPAKSVHQNLAKLVRLCLGKKVNKFNQFSDWAQQRPKGTAPQIYEAIGRQLTHVQSHPNEILNALLNNVRPNDDGSPRRAGRPEDGSSCLRRNHRDGHNKRHAL